SSARFSGNRAGRDRCPPCVVSGPSEFFRTSLRSEAMQGGEKKAAVIPSLGRTHQSCFLTGVEWLASPTARDRNLGTAPRLRVSDPRTCQSRRHLARRQGARKKSVMKLNTRNRFRASCAVLGLSSTLGRFSARARARNALQFPTRRRQRDEYADSGP